MKGTARLVFGVAAVVLLTAQACPQQKSGINVAEFTITGPTRITFGQSATYNVRIIGTNTGSSAATDRLRLSAYPPEPLNAPGIPLASADVQLPSSPDEAVTQTVSLVLSCTQLPPPPALRGPDGVAPALPVMLEATAFGKSATLPDVRCVP